MSWWKRGPIVPVRDRSASGVPRSACVELLESRTMLSASNVGVSLYGKSLGLPIRQAIVEEATSPTIEVTGKARTKSNPYANLVGKWTAELNQYAWDPVQKKYALSMSKPMTIDLTKQSKGAASGKFDMSSLGAGVVTSTANIGNDKQVRFMIKTSAGTLSVTAAVGQDASTVYGVWSWKIKKFTITGTISMKKG